jgi:hypothetical protein
MPWRTGLSRIVAKFGIIGLRWICRVHGYKILGALAGYSASNRFLNTPIPSISTSVTSPGFR